MILGIYCPSRKGARAYSAYLWSRWGQSVGIMAAEKIEYYGTCIFRSHKVDTTIATCGDEKN